MRVKKRFRKSWSILTSESIDLSASTQMRFIASTASIGYMPEADSADSITASVPSSTALATSLTSARVGCGETIMLSSICVATMATLP